MDLKRPRLCFSSYRGGDSPNAKRDDNLPCEYDEKCHQDDTEPVSTPLIRRAGRVIPRKVIYGFTHAGCVHEVVTRLIGLIRTGHAYA